ncbi:unnamed protein product, partial [Citrullus colocynthis]
KKMKRKQQWMKKKKKKIKEEEKITTHETDVVGEENEEVQFQFCFSRAVNRWSQILN